ncbi:hypothetical protein C0584_03890 [Candidatus Parcubacteria bacterium]|nr:MAG: hypothetical protein C0584_03890 [Candidatus Parcubacteria bacterium]
MTTFNSSDLYLSEMIIALVIESIRQNTKSERLVKKNLNALYKTLDHLAKEGKIPSQLAKSFRTIRNKTLPFKESEMDKKHEVFFPEYVGGAKIHWSEIDLHSLERMIELHGDSIFMSPPKIFLNVRGKHIILPRNLLREIHMINDGTQAIARFDYKGPCRYIFFGMDENPFMTGVTRTSWNVFKTQGEKAFYSSLIPDEILEIFALAGKPILRQGDIWATKLADTWHEAVNTVNLHLGLSTKTKHYIEANNHPLFNTNHLLGGGILVASKTIKISPKKKSRKTRQEPDRNTQIDFHLASGTISAPDHEDLVLKNGVYVVARSKNLTTTVSWEKMFD